MDLLIDWFDWLIHWLVGCFWCWPIEWFDDSIELIWFDLIELNHSKTDSEYLLTHLIWAFDWFEVLIGWLILNNLNWVWLIWFDSIWFVGWLSDCLIGCLIWVGFFGFDWFDWLFNWIYWLIDWLIDWLVLIWFDLFGWFEWLIGWLIRLIWLI